MRGFYSMADGIKQMVKESDGSKIYGRMEKETVIRIISARKANKYEEEIYFNEISD